MAKEREGGRNAGLGIEMRGELGHGQTVAGRLGRVCRAFRVRLPLSFSLHAQLGTSFIRQVSRSNHCRHLLYLSKVRRYSSRAKCPSPLDLERKPR